MSPSPLIANMMAGGGGLFDPLTVAGMVYVVQTDNVVLNGTGYADSITNLMPSAEQWVRSGADSGKFQGNTTEFAGHTVLYRQSGSTRFLEHLNDLVWGALFSGFNKSMSFGAFCRGIASSFPGQTRHQRIVATSNSINHTSPTTTDTTGTRFQLVGNGTGGGAAAGTTNYDVAYTRNTSWGLTSINFNGSTRIMEAFQNGVSQGSTAVGTIRDVINLDDFYLGDNVTFATDGYYGGWYAASAELSGDDHLNMYNWFVSSFA